MLWVPTGCSRWLSTELEKCPTLADFRQVKTDPPILLRCLHDRNLLADDSGLSLVLKSVTAPANLNDVGMVQEPIRVADVSEVLYRLTAR